MEVHLATEFQNIILDGGAFPDDLKQRMYAYVRENLASERGADDTEEQFIYKSRKKVWGPFKQQVWTLPEDTRAAIRALLEQKLEFLYQKLGVIGSAQLVNRYVTPQRIARPQPAVMNAVTA